MSYTMMKKLMPYEYKWIAKRLKVYDIKYAEIYNEIYDHMVSAVEGKRAQGDNRPILVLFQETMDQDIGSHRGIADMTAKRQVLVRGILRETLTSAFFSYFRTWRALWFVGAIALAYGIASLWSLPGKTLLLPAFILSIIPWVYFLGFGTVHKYLRTVRSRRKASLVNYLTAEITGFFFLAFYCLVFALPGMAAVILGYDIVHSQQAVVSFLGIPGMSVLVGLAFIFAKAAIALIRTDYRQMIRHVATR